MVTPKRRWSPVGPHVREPYPEPTVRRHEPYSATGPLNCNVPQRQHLQLQDGARVHATSHGQEEREENRHDGAEKRMLWSPTGSTV
jgi:hypothetical protein